MLDASELTRVQSTLQKLFTCSPGWLPFNLTLPSSTWKQGEVKRRGLLIYLICILPPSASPPPGKQVKGLSGISVCQPGGHACPTLRQVRPASLQILHFTLSHFQVGQTEKEAFKGSQVFLPDCRAGMPTPLSGRNVQLPFKPSLSLFTLEEKRSQPRIGWGAGSSL